MNNDLKLIKKYYGEDMMKFCREAFPNVLEKEGLLFQTMRDCFFPSRSLYKDLDSTFNYEGFKNMILNIALGNEIPIKFSNKTPFELINEAGYDLYECKTEEEIQSFKKYYEKNEELCTFRNKRLDNYYVFFAVKKNVSKIKRENFPKPERQDEYGTSVISIQFTKDESKTLYIRNRYNAIVKHADATFSNNLDNIIEGLTSSFENIGYKQRRISLIELQGYVQATDGRYYKYNYDIESTYYCQNNIIIDRRNVAIQLEKEKYILADYFIFDLVEKKSNFMAKILKIVLLNQ